MFSKLSLIHRISQRKCSNWFYKTNVEFKLDEKFITEKFVVKYVDTAANNDYNNNCGGEKVVLVLPDCPADSDSYLKLSARLCKNIIGCRVIVPNIQSSVKVERLSPSNNYSCYLSNYTKMFLTSFLNSINVSKIDVIISDGWSGYDAINLSSSFINKTNVILVNFPKVLSCNNSTVYGVPLELARNMLFVWNNAICRSLIKHYINYKHASFQKLPKFANLSQNEIINCLLTIGGIDFEETKFSLLSSNLCNDSTIGLVNLPGFKQQQQQQSSGETLAAGVLFGGDCEVHSVTVGLHGEAALCRPSRRYELQLHSHSPPAAPVASGVDNNSDKEVCTLDSEIICKFISQWINKLLTNTITTTTTIINNNNNERKCSE